MELQEMFDRVAIHLLTQNERSETGPDGPCRYHGPGGLKCALGFLIPPSKYSPKFEGISPALPSQFLRHPSVSANIMALNAALGLTNTREIELAQSLQNVHDLNPVSTWAGSLQVVAEHFGLSSQVVTEFRARSVPAPAVMPMTQLQEKTSTVAAASLQEKGCLSL